MRAILERDFLSVAARPRAFLVRWLAGLAVAAAVGVPFLLASRAEVARPDVLGAQVFRAGGAALLVVLALLTPPAAVGGILGERIRATLPLVLATPVGPGGFALAKMLSRTGTAFSLAAVALPPLTLPVLLGGVGLSDVVDLAASALGLVLELAAWSLVVSALSRRLATAVLLAYALPLLRWVLVGILMAGRADPPVDLANPGGGARAPLALGLSWTVLKSTPLPAFLGLFDPDGARGLARALVPPAAGASGPLLDLLALPGTGYLLAAAAAAAAAVLLAGRALAAERTGSPWGSGIARAFARLEQRGRSSPAGNPMAWKETRRLNGATSRPLYWTVLLLLSAVEAAYLARGLSGTPPERFRDLGLWIAAGQATTLALVAAVTAAAGIGQEKALGTLDLLRASPLTAQEVLAGKSRGVHRGILFLGLVPAVHLLALGALGTIPAFTALLAGVLVALLPAAWATAGFRCGIHRPSAESAVFWAVGVFSVALVGLPLLHVGLDALANAIGGSDAAPVVRFLSRLALAGCPPVTVYASLRRYDAGTPGPADDGEWGAASLLAAWIWVTLLYLLVLREREALPRALARSWRWEGHPPARSRVRSWIDARRSRARRHRGERKASLGPAHREPAD